MSRVGTFWDALKANEHIKITLNDFILRFQKYPPPNRVQKQVIDAFTTSLTQAYSEWSPSRTQATVNQFYTECQAEITNTLHHELLFDPFEAEKDKRIEHLLTCLGPILVPEHLDFRSTPELTQTIPLILRQLQEIPEHRNVEAKMNRLIEASKLICDAIGGDVGADSMLPVLTFCLAKAKVRTVVQQMGFCARWSSKSEIGEEAYYLTMALSALSFLETIEPGSLTMSEAELAHLSPFFQTQSQQKSSASSVTKSCERGSITSNSTNQTTSTANNNNNDNNNNNSDNNSDNHNNNDVDSDLDDTDDNHQHQQNHSPVVSSFVVVSKTGVRNQSVVAEDREWWSTWIVNGNEVEDPTVLSQQNAIELAMALPVTKEGFLEKRGAINRAWKRRYFRLRGNVLFYYKAPKAQKHSGCIVLTHAFIRPGSRNHQFEICVPRRTFKLRSADQATTRQWLDSCRASSRLSPSIFCASNDDTNNIKPNSNNIKKNSLASSGTSSHFDVQKDNQPHNGIGTLFPDCSCCFPEHGRTYEKQQDAGSTTNGTSRKPRLAKGRCISFLILFVVLAVGLWILYTNVHAVSRRLSNFFRASGTIGPLAILHDPAFVFTNPEFDHIMDAISSIRNTSSTVLYNSTAALTFATVSNVPSVVLVPGLFASLPIDLTRALQSFVEHSGGHVVATGSITALQMFQDFATNANPNLFGYAGSGIGDRSHFVQRLQESNLLEHCPSTWEEQESFDYVSFSPTKPNNRLVYYYANPIFEVGGVVSYNFGKGKLWYIAFDFFSNPSEVSRCVLSRVIDAAISQNGLS